MEVQDLLARVQTKLIVAPTRFRPDRASRPHDKQHAHSVRSLTKLPGRRTRGPRESGGVLTKARNRCGRGIRLVGAVTADEDDRAKNERRRYERAHYITLPSRNVLQ